jgi:hypothetical protein
MDELRLFILKDELLQTASAAEGATERGKTTHVPGRNANADCLEDRGATFCANKNIY